MTVIVGGFLGHVHHFDSCLQLPFYTRCWKQTTSPRIVPVSYLVKEVVLL